MTSDYRNRHFAAFEAAMRRGYVRGSFIVPGYVHSHPIGRCVFEDCELVGASFAHAMLTACRFVRVRLTDVSLEATLFRACAFEHIAFVRCQMRGVEFPGCVGTREALWGVPLTPRKPALG